MNYKDDVLRGYEGSQKNGSRDQERKKKNSRRKWRGCGIGKPTRFPIETGNTHGVDGLREGNDGCCLISVPHMGALRDTFH